jgi:hypothetical protein
MSALDDSELELFARHVSLPEIGARGQARLLETKAFVGEDVPAREALLVGLSRSGVELVSDAALAHVCIEAAALNPAGTIDFDAGRIDVGPFELSLATRLEASSARAAKELWLGAILASEIVLFLLREQAGPFTLVFDYPHYRRR